MKSNTTIFFSAIYMSLTGKTANTTNHRNMSKKIYKDGLESAIEDEQKDC
ncbi:hypothetical protein GCM10020331_005850 [Ectobacillus funiculus]